MAIYTAWGRDGAANVFGPGEGPHRTIDGTLMNDVCDGECPDLVWTVEADSWEEAMTRYHELQGWEPYVPMSREALR